MIIEFSKDRIYEYNLQNNDEFRKMINHLCSFYYKRIPFFTTILLTLCDVEDIKEKGVTAYTFFNYRTKRITIRINTEVFEKEKYGKEEIIYILMHEVLHNYFQHMSRLKKEFKENHQLTNIIADYYCNEFLDRLMNGPKVLKGIIRYESLSNLSKQLVQKDLPFNSYGEKPLENTLYDFFMKGLDDYFAKQPGIKGGANGFNGQFKEIDDHEKGMENEEKTAKEFNEGEKFKKGEKTLERIKSDILESSFKEIQKSCTMSEREKDVVRFKDFVLQPNKLLNTLKLKRIVTKLSMSNNSRTYERLNRKRNNDTIVFKGKRQEKQEKIVIALDVSGSITDDIVHEFVNMFNSYVNHKKNQVVIDIIYWSSTKIEEGFHFYKDITKFNDFIKTNMNTSGGTEISFLYDFIDDYYKEKINLINITDGYWDFRKIPECIQTYYMVLTEEHSRIEALHQNTQVKFVYM